MFPEKPSCFPSLQLLCNHTNAQLVANMHGTQVTPPTFGQRPGSKETPSRAGELFINGRRSSLNRLANLDDR